MPLFFLICGLNSRRKCENLQNGLNNFQAVKILKSTWCFDHPETNTSNLRDYFMKHVDPDDDLIVLEVSDWACRKTFGSPSNSEFLASNID